MLPFDQHTPAPQAVRRPPSKTQLARLAVDSKRLRARERESTRTAGNNEDHGVLAPTDREPSRPRPSSSTTTAVQQRPKAHPTSSKRQKTQSTATSRLENAEEPSGAAPRRKRTAPATTRAVDNAGHST
ncbi:hypothetical protein PUNSTDRAFT_130192 [Punctularia strigosozonata HHB-11173 SS5]|uniref:uncharacterized protein n=1 Tax=Punctularia strigosozonata (strain HHB-11173) TaxID=741275 RepID=UPI000441678D|nr:uncharacterized protein PUNSTDRAFT_130192 [Punctularia strigosozonata HHB-11173 SS5]EIN14561.1 hypothetical protein PUNSTDRAFT_130192 [Punctularia strigosozonata HHB-11173 SS5]